LVTDEDVETSQGPSASAGEVELRTSRLVILEIGWSLIVRRGVHSSKVNSGLPVEVVVGVFAVRHPDVKAAKVDIRASAHKEKPVPIAGEVRRNVLNSRVDDIAEGMSLDVADHE